MIFTTYPYLTHGVITIHKLSKEDTQSLDLLKHDPLVYRYEPSFLPELKVSNPQVFIEETCDQLFNAQEGIILGIYQDNNLLGLAELYDYVPQRNKISIGYRLRSCYWHQGYASQTVALLKDYLLNDCGITRITAHVIADNIASAKALLHNGFVQRRETHDEDWGLDHLVKANKFVIYPKDDTL